MNIDLIRILEQGTVTDEHGHVLSGTAKLLYLLHRPISSIQDWEIKAGEAFVQKYLCT
jgi:hypothetical protein